MNVWELIEAIDDPSGLIHPEKQQAFARQTHPLAKHPSYPAHQPGPGDRHTNYEEILASKQWQKILQKANQYLGVPLTAQALPVIQQKLMSAMRLISEVEANRREQLEALAVQLVFELPEFKSAHKAHENNQIRIEAQLGDNIDTEGMATSDEPPPEPVEPPQRTPADQEWMKKMVQRRHFTNAMIQGSAVSNDFLFEMAGAALDHIHPGLRKAYGVLMISTEIGYWMFPQNAVIAGAKSQTHVGSVRVGMEPVEPLEEEPGEAAPPAEEQAPQAKIPVVHASGMCFPVLIQEIIKGLTELASLPSLPRDAAERQEVINQTDLVDMEAWSMMLGPKLWDSFIEAVDAENERELTMHLYRHIQMMDVDEFNAFMKEVLAKTPHGMQMLRQLAARVKTELAEEGEEPMAESVEIVRQLIENEDDDLDWKDVTRDPPRPGRYSQPFSGTRGHVIEGYVRRLGLGGAAIGTDQFHDGIFTYVTVEFPESSGQAPMTAKFVDLDSAENFLDYLYRINELPRQS